MRYKRCLNLLYINNMNITRYDKLDLTNIVLDKIKVTDDKKIINLKYKTKVDGKTVENTKVKPTYLAFNKPVGIVCTTDTRVEKNNIIDFINYPARIFPIGRLDKDSEGLILLTDDGDIVNKILRSSNNHDKEYIVTVDKPISQTFIKRMTLGVPILDTTTKPCIVEKINRTTFKIILTQGLNRQIRRMCSYFGYEVQTLKRVRIMNIPLKSKVGQYRHLTEEELNTLNNLLLKSKKN